MTLAVAQYEQVSAESIEVIQKRVVISSTYEQVQLLVRPGGNPVNSIDLTSKAEFSSLDPKIAVVSESGQVTAKSKGKTQIEITANGSTIRHPVEVLRFEKRPKISFMHQVRPILNKMGCAGAACHASQYGKGGFKLSVFGFDPNADHEAIARASRQRRINFAAPDESLFIKKGLMSAPHGGGRRFSKDSQAHQILKAWVEAGAPRPSSKAAEISRIEVTPKLRVGVKDGKQQLRVVAHYDDKSVRDVTDMARFDSMDDGMLYVDPAGLVEMVGQGQSGIMVRYEGHAKVATFLVPYAKNVDLADWKPNNFVDELAAVKFKELGIRPSGLCDDETFIRRAFLDSIGGLPSVEEVERFVKSKSPKKRSELIDQLLGLTGDQVKDIYNDRYAAFWTLRWSDLIRNNSNSLGEQGMWALHNWIREAFRTNRPFNQFVQELVTAKGSIYSNGPANYFRINANSSALTEATAQLFMGVRLECAKCHHHPFEKYSQADYYGLAAFFSRVGSKRSEEFGLFGRETVIVVKASGDVRHPRTGKTLPPTPLGGKPKDDPLDRRLPLADWLTAKENEFFARSVVNRYMRFLLGRGLVEPVDDMRSTNPPSNIALMDRLADEFTKSDFNLKQLIRTIMNSRLYQLSSQPSAENVSDRRFYSHFYVKRLAAEPLLDAVNQVTGTQTKFKSLPLGTRAIELPDAEYPNYFLKTFAKPKRASVCECERSPDENLAQALHTLNGMTLSSKIADKNGMVAKLIKEKKEDRAIVIGLYRAALCRHPSDAELNAAKEFLKESPSPKECYEDLLWALINSKQFLYVR